MTKNKEVIEGPEIKIIGRQKRFEIVRKVVTAFIEFEKDKKGKGIEFRYPVEDLPKGEKLYIHRPGVKWNFDFKVEIPVNCGLKEGSHAQIALILRKTKGQNVQEYYKLWVIISQLYHCSINNVDCLLQQNPISIVNPQPEVLLKVIKWLFIMEDIIYWHYEGRAFLYNFFVYVTHETDNNRLNNTLSGIRKRKIKPDKIKILLKHMCIEWKLP